MRGSCALAEAKDPFPYVSEYSLRMQQVMVNFSPYNIRAFEDVILALQDDEWGDKA